VQFKFEPSHWKFPVQRHLFPSLVTLQVEFGQSLQSLDELQLGSFGISQLIISSSGLKEFINLNGGLTRSFPLESLASGFPSFCLGWMTNIHALELILVTR